MRRAFVSYSRKNLDVVTQLIQDIQAVGIDTWHDQTLTGGQRWWDNILANIRECDTFICALSPESWDSEACKSELAYASQLGKAILPVIVADGINLNLLPAPLNEIQVTDYRSRDKGAAFALIKSIHTAPANPLLPDPLPTPPRVPISYLSNLTERIDSAEPLDSQEQITLLFELEAGLREGRSPTEIRDLLLRLKRRDDLLAKVAVKIDTALRGIEDHSPGPPLNGATFSAGAAAATTPGRNGSPGGPSKEPGTAKPAVPVPVTHTEIGRSKSRKYACALADSGRVIAEVKCWLDSLGFDSQQMSTETDSILLQIKKRGGWRDFVGMSTSLNIVFHPSADTLTVEIGAGKWIDKAAVGAVSMFILWPLAVTAGVGAWEQAKMPAKIFDYIGTRLVYT